MNYILKLSTIILSKYYINTNLKIDIYKIVHIHDQILQLHSMNWDSTRPLPNKW